MIAMTAAEFDQAVQEALDSIPAEFHEYLDNVVIESVDAPDARLQREYGIPEDALGFYAGTPLDERGPGADPLLPDRIFIFRNNLCEMCDTREELIEEIGITVLHEVGHHFGMDEDRLRDVGFD